MRAFCVVSLLFLLCGQGCKLSQNTQLTQQNKSVTDFTPNYETAAMSPILVYKTKDDYRNLVPVILSTDGKKIVSYPAPTDIKRGGKLTLPTELHNGYLLDNRGINQHVAFLSYTYEAYAQLPEAPSIYELYQHILVKDPLLELCDCGNKSAFKNVEEQLNELIDKKLLRKKCKAIR